MKKIASFEERIPIYALPALINDDASGLKYEDIENIFRFMQPYFNKAKQSGATIYIDVPEDAQEYFTHSPAFGLACTVIDCTIYLLK